MVHDEQGQQTGEDLIRPMREIGRTAHGRAILEPRKLWYHTRYFKSVKGTEHWTCQVQDKDKDLPYSLELKGNETDKNVTLLVDGVPVLTAKMTLGFQGEAIPALMRQMHDLYVSLNIPWEWQPYATHPFKE